MIRKLIPILILTIFSVFMPKEVKAAQCASNECNRPGEYVCSNGTMCCTPGGCPSYACSRAGDIPYIGGDGNWWCCPGNRWNNASQCAGGQVPAYQAGGTCRYCAGGPTTPPPSGDPLDCRQLHESHVLLPSAPAHNSIFNYNPAANTFAETGAANITLRWGGPYQYHSTRCNFSSKILSNCAPDWGESCQQPRRYLVYLNGALFKTVTVSGTPGSGSTAVSFNQLGNRYGEHTWRVVACSGNNCINHDSGWDPYYNPMKFFVNPAGTSVQGLIWNATGQSCTANPPESLEIVRGSNPGNIPNSSSISVTMDGTTSGIWDTSQSGYSYRFNSVPAGNHVITANVPDPVGFSNSQYYLACVNGQDARAASVNAQSNPTLLHLGFKISSQGWFNVSGGDVFAGCTFDNCVNSVSMAVPPAADVLGGFADALISTPGNLFASSLASVRNSLDQNKLTSDSNRFTTLGTGSTGMERDFSFEAPSYANEISGNACNNMFTNFLSPTQTYKATRGCVQNGLDNLNGEYSLTSNGVTVVYIEEDGQSLAFTKDFRSNSQNQRIIFVSVSPIEVSSAIGEASPTISSRAHIEASLVSRHDITFYGNEDEGQEDSTIIVEGPLASINGGIRFERDRISQNGYPAEYIRYNPIYLTKQLPTDQRGIGVVDFTWMLNN